MSSSHNAMEAVVAGFQQGTSRPAAAIALKGFFYHNESTDITSYCDGASWLDLGSFSSPVALTVGGSNVEGVVTSAARADHEHQLAGFGTTVQTDGTLSSGVANLFSRADHKHSIGANVITDTMIAPGTLSNDISGNAATATFADTAGAAGPSSTAETLVPGRTVEITGDITSTPVLFDGSANIQISASVDDNSHSHSTHTLSGDVTGTLGSTTVSNASNASLLGGLALASGGGAPGANQVFRSNSLGYLYTGWINTVSGNHTGSVTRIYASNDPFIRYVTAAHFRTQVVAPAFLNSGTHATSGAKVTVSNGGNPSGGVNGDIWLKY